MIDLHLHTYFSDGTLSPEALVHRAKSMGVNIMAITDHDGLEGIEEGMASGKKIGITVIPGIEFSTSLPEKNIFSRNAEAGQEIYMHLLGYGMDITNKPLNAAVDDIRAKRVIRNSTMLNALSDLGYKLSREDLQVHPNQEYIGKPNMARALIKKGYIGHIREAFRDGQYLGHPSIKSIHRIKIDIVKAIELIHGAGGKAVLAHPMKISYAYKKQEGGFFEKLEALLIFLKSNGLDGIECYYNNSQLITETEHLLELADKYELLISAGTDFHGPEMNSEIEIGKFPIPPLKSNLQHSIRQ